MLSIRNNQTCDCKKLFIKKKKLYLKSKKIKLNIDGEKKIEMY